MPKQRRKRGVLSKTQSEKRNGTGPIQQLSAEEAVTKNEMVIPVVKQLGSTLSTERALAATAIATLVQDADARSLLLKERVVLKLLGNGIHDSSMDVVLESFGALRAIAMEEGYDQTVYMYKNNILTPIEHLMNKLKTLRSETLQHGGNGNSELLKTIFWPLEEHLYCLLKCLCETNDHIVASVNKIEVLAWVLYTFQDIESPENVKIAALQFLYSITEDNTTMAAVIALNSAMWITLTALLAEHNDRSVRILAAGVLHNVYECALDSDEDLAEHLSQVDRLILKPLLQILSQATRRSAAYDNKEEEQIKLLLEVISSCAASIQTTMEEGEGNISEAMDTEDVASNNGDETMISVTEPEEFSPRAILVQALLNATDEIKSLYRPLLSAYDCNTRVIDCLNNIIWTLKSFPNVRKTSKLNSIWSWCVSICENNPNIILSTNFFSLFHGLAWQLDSVQASDIQIVLNLAGGLFNHADAMENYVAAIGHLGCIGDFQSNERISNFLTTCIMEERTPVRAVCEALNAIFEIYGDEAKPTDVIFKQNVVLGKLELAVPKLLRALKMIDKGKEPETRAAVDEALENLIRFCRYRRSLN